MLFKIGHTTQTVVNSFCVVYHHPCEDLLWSKALRYGWIQKEVIDIGKIKSNEFHNHTPWHIFERDSVVYPAGPFVYCSFEPLNFPNIFIVGVDV